MGVGVVLVVSGPGCKVRGWVVGVVMVVVVCGGGCREPVGLAALRVCMCKTGTRQAGRQGLGEGECQTGWRPEHMSCRASGSRTVTAQC